MPTEPYVRRLCAVLLDAVADKDPRVQEQVCAALHGLGESRPEDMLSACEGYLRQHEKLAPPCRARILQAMETVLRSRLDELDKDRARALTLLAAAEMTRVKELVSDWQQAASSVLVAVGRRFVGLVMEELLTRFQPGVLPHCFVVRTLADLSVSNVLGTVPFLTSILSTMLPMLGWAKHDSTRVVFCYAVQRFSESALEYLASLDQAPDPTVRKDSFAADISGAYEVLFHHWLQGREAKLRLAVVRALGPMSQLLPGEKLEEQLPKLLPGVLALYKKHAEALPVSQSLGQILEAAVGVGSRTLEPQLDSLLAALHAQVCVSVETPSPLALRNQKEVLRCLTALACCSPDRLLGFLLPKLGANDERTRVGSLQILRHVINSAPAHMEAKKPFVLASLRLPLLDSSDKVKRAVVQVVSAMAHHGYLEQPGGEAVVEYVVRQCALPAQAEAEAEPGPDGETPAKDSVRSISVSTLYLVSTTVDRMGDVLWPYLLEFLTPVGFTGALTPLCRSLLHLAQKRQQEQPHGCLINYSARATLPSPYAITTRLLTVSCDPYAGDGRGPASLRLLRVLHGNVHPLLGQRWETTIPLLLEHLDEHTEESLLREEWEEKLLTFLRDTLATVADNTWTCQLSLEMCKQLPSYDGAPREKSFLYRCIGTALGAAADGEVVRKRLQELLDTARHQEGAEREGLACCFGICAASHLDDTLAQLEDCVQSEVFRKSAGIFSLFKERSETEAERVRSTLILCYGQVAAQAPRELVLARLEADILRNMFLCFHTKVLGVKVESKDPALKLCLVRSVCAASRAVSSSAHAGAFHFAQKAELVAQMLEFIKAEPPDSLRTPMRMKAMRACSHLVPLEPALEEPLQASLIRGCLHSVLAVQPGPEGPGDREALFQDTVQALGHLLAGLLHRNVTPQGLQVMLEHLSPWIKSPRGHERARALGLSAHLLRHFLEHLHVSALVPFHNLGLLVGLFSPRCADLCPASRQEALRCVHALLYVQLGYEGFSRDHRDEAAEQLLALREGLVHPDPSTLFHTCHSVAQVVARRLPPDQLIGLLLTLFEGLGDPDGNCSRAASVMVGCLLKERGHMLLDKVPEVVSVLRCRLQETPAEHVLQAARHSVHLLATQHHAAVVSSLLGSPLPFDSHSCMLWRALAAEPSLTARVLGLLLDKMGCDVPFKESRAFLLSSSPERVATLLPLAATCALREVVDAPEASPAVLELYPRLLAALLLRVSCTLDVQLPRSLQAKEKERRGPGPGPPSLEPCSSAVAALRAVLLRGGSEDVVRRVELQGGWELLQTPAGHDQGVALLARAMAQLAGPRLPATVRALLCAQRSVYEAQRATATAFLAELLGSKVAVDLMLLDALLDALLARQKDSSPRVRRLVLRGLANVASGSREQVPAHSPQLLTAMVAGLDDGDDPHNLVALEAMVGLARLLDLLEPRELRSVLLHVAIRVRPFFDSEKAEFRAASIQLFGRLHEVCGADCEDDVFLEQALGGLAPLLLHLQDPQAPVAEACRCALRACAPRLQCEELSAAFQKHLQEGRGLHFGEFLNTTCRHLMQHFPELLGRLASTSLFYFKSAWEDVRAAAPLLTGFLVLHAEPEQRAQVDLEQLLAALQLLLRDPAPAVRARAAETLGRLVRFA